MSSKRFIKPGPGVVHGSAHGSCMRTIRWCMPILLGAMLSSYVTYVWMYHLRANQQQWDSRSQHPAAASTGFSSGTTTDPTADPRTSISSSSSSSGGGSSRSSKQTATGSRPAGPAGGHRLSSHDAAFQWVKAAGRPMRVALVNEAPYHLEIVAGLLQVLTTMPVDITWYQAGQSTPDGTFTATQLLEVTGFTQLLGYLPHMLPSTASPAPCDFAILVSPEYFEQATKAFLAAARPVTAVVLAHNGMNTALQHIQAFHPRLHFAALSPHVAAAARHVLKIHAHWFLPTFKYTGMVPCGPDSPDPLQCMHGFAVQGNFEAARRNYTRLWLQVQQAMAAKIVPTQPPVRPFHLHLVGRGNVSTLNMPPAVANMTTVHFNLKFPEYYGQLQRTHALLMLLGNINYLVQKMSSTVVSSLMTGVPIIADNQVLASYTFLKPEHIFLIGPHETEMDVMQRVLHLSTAEVLAARQKVLGLQEYLNKRAFAVLQAFMPSVDDMALTPL